MVFAHSLDRFVNIQMAGTSLHTKKTALLKHSAAEPSVTLYAAA